MINKTGLTILALAVVLVGCERNKINDSRYFCSGFNPSSQITSTLSAACTGCSVSDLPAAIDNQINSFADLGFGTAVASQGITVRATQASGSTAFAAGTNAGALVNIGNADVSQVTVTLNTYLAGTLQETSTPTISGVMNSDSNQPNGYYGFVTLKSFDAVEFQILNSSSSALPQSVHLNGMCSDGGPLY